MTLNLTEEEKDYLYASGFSGFTDAIIYYAQLGDKKILPLIDKNLDLLFNSNLYFIHQAYWDFKKYARKNGDEGLFKELEKRDEELIQKYNLKIDDSIRIDYHELY